MRSRLLLLALVTGLVSVSLAYAGDGKDGEDVLRKSGVRSPRASYPLPFNITAANPRTDPAISTGYYFVDSDDEVPEYWRPDPSQFIDTLTEPGTWRQIVSGPRQQPPLYWNDPLRNIYGGYAYFRNPGNMNDSTDDAFAGPISIGFPFYFNGVRYDSFYVSTNGLMALSNRRYFYEFDAQGFPVRRQALEIRPGQFSVYDPAGDDTRGRTATGTDTTDATPDNWGYQYVACGNNPANPTSGIRTKTNRMLDQGSIDGSGAWAGSTRPALIAPFWDDLQVSVYDSERSIVDNFGQVWYKRSPANDRLIVYFVNLTPIGAKTAVVGAVTQNVNFPVNNRPGVGQHYRMSGQVILNRTDSTVTFQYERFLGNAPTGALQPLPASAWMRCNSTVGVSGGARRLNDYPTSGPTTLSWEPHVTRYTQSTEYLYNVDTDPNGGVRATPAGQDGGLPHDFLAIRFKQWKNVLRVINVSYRVRPQNNNAPLDFSVPIPPANANNYELLAGETRLGAIQPVVIVQNLTNNIQGPQGVNFTPQGINFQVRFRITNEATGQIVYNRSQPVTDALLRDSTAGIQRVQRSDINGVNQPYLNPGTYVTPYEFIKVTFMPWEPNPFIDYNIGRLVATVIAEPKDTMNLPLGDEWPYDDTTGVRLFVMRRLAEFNDDVREFHVVGGAYMPSVLKWVNIESQVVSGDEATNNPPPPRGEYTAANSQFARLRSPVIRMNRKTLGDGEIPPPGQYGGDELRSFPINLVRRKNAVLSISYQRAGKITFPRGFSDNSLVGPEHRVNGLAVNTATPFIRNADELWVEFAKPSDDGVTGITNIANWVLDMANFGTQYAQPFRIWGGGGYMRGYDLVNKNQQLNQSATPPLGGLREDLFDDGKDFEFYKVTIPIPDTVLRWVNEGARNFRFRLRVRAMRNSSAPNPADDDDDFFVDNVRILFPNEVTDIELSNIQLIWPYTMAPASQATRIPIRIKLSNNTHIPAPAFSVQIKIKPENNESQWIYCRTITVPTLPGNREVILPFPDANFRTTTPGNYKVTGKIFFPGGDLDSLNDSTFTMFEIRFGPSFAYEANPLNPVNDVPKLAFSGVTGKGLNHRGFSSGSTAATWTGVNNPQYTPGLWGQFSGGVSADEMFGADAGNSSGQIAMRFTLYTQDTVLGYQAFWAELNQDILNISFTLYRDQGGVPGETIANSTMIKHRGEDELDNTPDPVFGKYVTYLLNKPAILPPGEYWASVAQMGTEGYELGASQSRMGMVTTVYSDIPAFGIGNRSLLVDKNFRVRSRGGALLNDNRFAYELTRFSGDWVPFTPTIGNPGYPHLGASGLSLGYHTFTRGSWIPLLRPYFGPRSFNSPPIFVPCVIPVELTFFDGKPRSNGVDLFWETASEKNNMGFHVERRAMKETTNLSTGESTLSCVDNSDAANAPWTSIAFVPGANNSTQTINYKHFDDKVSSGTNYEYRLRQVDRDGAESFSNIINVVFSNDNDVALDDNFPNPSNGKTTFRFRVPFRSNVKLEVYDMMGNLVNTLYDQQVAGSNGFYAIEWNGRNAAGYEVTSGSYMYKLTAGDVVTSKTMTVVR